MSGIRCKLGSVETASTPADALDWLFFVFILFWSLFYFVFVFVCFWWGWGGGSRALTG